MIKRPTVLYPTVKSGVIHGIIRCESLDGSELWLPPTMADNMPGFHKDGSGYILDNVKPFDFGGKTWCISHLQKKAKYFSLLYDPFIYHQGYFWHLQEQDKNGGWIPGSEKGIYWRTPGFRWQKPDANSDWTPWILSGGRIPGMHLD